MSDRTIDVSGREWRILPVVRADNHNCRHCYHFAAGDVEDDTAPGECRLLSPRTENVLRWVVVGPDDFCGCLLYTSPSPRDS